MHADNDRLLRRCATRNDEIKTHSERSNTKPFLHDADNILFNGYAPIKDITNCHCERSEAISIKRLTDHRLHHRCNGFTLIEMVIIILVLSLALTGITLLINRAVQQSPEALVQTRAMELAQSYLDEILHKRFDEQTGQGGTPRCDSTDNAAQPCSGTLGSEEGARNAYDDVDDYHGLDDQPPITATGGNYDNYASYRVQISVSYAGSEIGLSSNRGAKRITVNVTTPLGNVIPVSAYRVNF